MNVGRIYKLIIVAVSDLVCYLIDFVNLRAFVPLWQKKVLNTKSQKHKVLARINSHRISNFNLNQSFTSKIFSNPQNVLFFILLFLFSCTNRNETARERELFTSDWKFSLGENQDAEKPEFDDSNWRILDLPHDWSIEGEFSEDNPAGTAGGALPGGIGWYRKSFQLKNSEVEKQFYIEFDGVYQNSEVWINGNYLGKRPYGYSSFSYDLTPYLKFGDEKNTISVKVDNSFQPNSRWYTGSGIYRNVWLVKTGKTHVVHWGTFITTPEVSEQNAVVKLEIQLKHSIQKNQSTQIKTEIFGTDEKLVADNSTNTESSDSLISVLQSFEIRNPQMWSVETPYLYTAKTFIYVDGKLTDNYETTFGIRTFNFDAEKGFFLNGNPLKIHGVNQHHDLGTLGAAVNTRAIERQLEILKEMGCNAIRTAHNPPAPEFLDLCDKMGFLVMNEAFDMWAKKKNKYDYHLFWDEWHKRDLQDLILRDRNHPSVIIWSIGNEIREQFDSTGIEITKELVGIIKTLDKTRPITCALTEQDPKKNFIYQSGALDLISFNYKHLEYLDFPKNYPGEKLLASENMSAFSTRGHYDMPSDEKRIWPPAYNEPFDGNDDFTCSAYDHVHAYWGATHEETWDVVANNDFVSGMFIWSGFDFIGEPVPYPWPARSSYYGIIDLCGFPKDVYYLYQSIWTEKPVLHLFPHWNWTEGEFIDVWAYFNNADEVELFLNGESLGPKSKMAGKYHVMWRVKYVPGTIKAVSRKNGKVVLEKEIQTAGNAAKIELTADRMQIQADGKDLSFITVKITDENGNLVPNAVNPVNFKVEGNGIIAGVDNGYQASMESFKAMHRKPFNGMCLLIVQSNGKSGEITVIATSDSLEKQRINISAK
jgi:beta-galactosidase